MSFDPHKRVKLGTGAQILAVAFLLFPFCTPNFHPTIAQKTASRGEGPAYFPADGINGFDGYVSTFLKSVGEPSLLVTAQDPRETSYRLISLAGQTGKILSVRLSLNSDGSAKIFTILDAGGSQPPRRAQSNVVAGDVRKFEQLVVKAGFWTMPSTDTRNDDGSRSYKMDASTWVFEGVRDRNYHVVLRRRVSPRSFDEIERFLLRDLSRIE